MTNYSLRGFKTIKMYAIIFMLATAVLIAGCSENYSNIDDYQVLAVNGHSFTSGGYGLFPNSVIHGQHRIMTYNGWQYAVYYSEAENGKAYVSLARRQLYPEVGGWQVITFTDYEYVSNDTHDDVRMGISGDGRIHLAFDHHGDELNYRVSHAGVANNPSNYTWSTSLFGPVTSQLVPGVTEKNVTYLYFIQVPNGNLQLIRRMGGSGNGDWVLYTYDASAQAWTKNGIIISRSGTYNGSTSRCAYIDTPQYEGNRLHIMWMWRENYPVSGPMTNHDLMYAYSDDYGITWKNNAGNVIATTGSNPIKVDTPGINVWTIPQNYGLLNGASMYVDNDGLVHYITSHAPETNSPYSTWEEARADARYYHYMRSTNGQWSQVRMNDVPIGTRSYVLVNETTKDALNVFGRANRILIAKATQAQSYQDWQVVYQSPNTPTMIFEDDFSGDLSKWPYVITNNAGSVQVTGGALELKHDGSAANGVYVDKRDYPSLTGKVVIEFKVKIQNLTQTQRFPQIRKTNGTNDDNSYIVGFNPNGNIIARTSAGDTVVGQYTPGQWYNIKIELFIVPEGGSPSSSYVLYINGEKKATVNNMYNGSRLVNLGEIRLPLYGQASGITQTCYIDDFKVYRPALSLSDPTPDFELFKMTNGGLMVFTQEKPLVAGDPSPIHVFKFD